MADSAFPQASLDAPQDATSSSEHGVSASGRWWQRQPRPDMLALPADQSAQPSPGRSTSPATSSNSVSDSDAVAQDDPSKWQSESLLGWPLRPSEFTSPVDSLPAELLINVLQHLPANHDILSAMLVSKTWCLAAFPLIWQRPPINNITQFAKFIRTVNDPGALLPYSATVRRLVCSGFARDLTDELFAKVACCRNLERLFLPGADLSDITLVSVFRHLPGLISIDLGGIDGVNDLVVQQIARVCTHVQGLNLTKCKHVGDEGVIAVATSLKMLRRMKLHGCHRLTDRAIIALARNCRLLSELDIMDIPQLSNDSTIAVFLNAECLRDLKMRESKDREKLDGNAIPNLWELSRMGEGQLFDSVGTYPWYLTGAAAPKAQAIAHKSARPPNVAASLLRPVRVTLDVLRVVDFTSCRGLGDAAVENLVCNAPQLRSLTLTKCDNITDASLDSISRLGKYIHYLHLGHVNQITDMGILQLSRNCTRLRYIDVANCSLLTDLSVVALATNLPKLRRIGLVKLTDITDDGIMPLADRFLTLERIHLSWCEKISVRAIAYLLNHLPLLTHLSLSGIPAFRTAELQRFCRAPPEGLTEGHRGAFCVYSGPGVVALRNYLNSQAVGQELSDTSSGRRSSWSSTSSITVPARRLRDAGSTQPAIEVQQDQPDMTLATDDSTYSTPRSTTNLLETSHSPALQQPTPLPLEEELQATQRGMAETSLTDRNSSPRPQATAPSSSSSSSSRTKAEWRMHLWARRSTSRERQATSQSIPPATSAANPSANAPAHSPANPAMNPPARGPRQGHDTPSRGRPEGERNLRFL